ncbi:actin-like ATPase domain-containing protein [Pseudovirgaria hyperparasitica]|uniref:Actin-like ATPase domain-containing protein n=1 Tax=Pseudovirgaria hyperparasitica TaxID=470096 RepID=A0A6A6W3J2_9PEZI|nr:actin-like ATPase domain-containing protein [Pseudovirgaria hyperparasitica]KAF2757173.1 actin-like ATPase domain-containing protein [Pseudovirgaria hyperparasitica]
MAPPGRRRGLPSTCTLLVGLLFFFASTASAASAVLGIDFGTEYIKAAIVKPGIPLEIVLTKDSKRKEASAIAFKPSKSTGQGVVYPERAYGGDALALAARFSGDVYPNLKPLLGKPLQDQSVVDDYQKLHPALQLVERDGRQTIAFKSKSFGDDGQAFSVEELLAMELQNIRDNAKTMAGKGTDVSEVVFTIPPFFTADEKRALETAANLAGFKVIGLITDGLAVGMNYATTRTFPDITKDDNKPEYHLVFDMGAGSTSATVLRFQGKTVKDIGRFNKTVQEVAVLGSGWDRTLGGDALNAVILDDMVTKFKESPGGKALSATTEDIKKHGRTMAKLWAQSEKSRQILSANSDTSASFESLYEDVDFRYKLSRTQYEAMTTEFAARVDGPITQALAQAELKWSDLDSVILHGGAVRTPFVQKRLESIADDKSKLRSNVNADEAAVFGAAFKAAGLSPSFRVKEIRDSDTNGYASGVQYIWNLKDRVQKLFTPTSPTGIVKEIPFKTTDEFEFTLWQEIPTATDQTVRSPVVQGRTENMTATVSKLVEDGCDREEIETKWLVRINPVDNLPEILKGSVSCEVEDTDKGGVLGGVKDFLGFGSKKGDQEPLKEGEEAPAENVSASSSAEEPAPSADTKVDSKVKEPKKKRVSSGIAVTTTAQGYEKFTKPEFSAMKDRLSAFDKSDKGRRDRAELQNSLEAYTYRTRDLLEDESFIAASTAEVRDKLSSSLSDISDWLYGEGSDATKEILKEKMKSLTDVVDPIIKRRDESVKRPEIIKTMEESLRQTKSMIDAIRNSIAEAAASAASAAEEAVVGTPSADPLAELDEDETPKTKPSKMDMGLAYTEDDLGVIEKAYESVESWLAEKMAAQDKLASHEDAAFSVRDVEGKAKELTEATMSILQKKIRDQQQQEKAKKSKSKSKSKSKTKKPTSTSTSSDAEQATPPVIELNVDQNGEPPSAEKIQKIVDEAVKGQEAEKQHVVDEL